MHLINQGGPYVQAILALAAVGLLALAAAAILAAIAKSTGKAEGLARAIAIGLLLCVPIPFILGLIGTWTGTQTTLQAVEVASINMIPPASCNVLDASAAVAKEGPVGVS